MSQIYKTSTGGGGGGTVTSLTGNSGTASPNGSGTIFVKGPNATVAGTGGGATFTGDNVNTLNLTLPGSGFVWQVQTTDFTPSPGNGYFLVKGSLLNIQLPATPTLGDTFIVIDIQGNLFEVHQNAGDQILLADKSTTIGAGGSVTSTKIGDTLMLVCRAGGAGASWVAIQPVGNFTVV